MLFWIALCLVVVLYEGLVNEFQLFETSDTLFNKARVYLFFIWRKIYFSRVIYKCAWFYYTER